MIKRSTMVLYTVSDIYSHRTRIVLAEKEVSVDVICLDQEDECPKDFLELNPEMKFPMLLDRELVLTESRIINEYVDERFPHPPLLPVYPVLRAKFRLVIHHLEQDWYVPLLKIIAGEQVAESIASLRDRIITVLPVLEKNDYFMGDSFSLVDCCIAPILWRLPYYGITFDEEQTKILDSYAEKLFNRDAFQASLTDAECDLREFDDF